MKKLLLIVLLASGLVLPCSAQVRVNCSMLDGDNNSNIYDSKFFVIKSAAQWKSLSENKVVSNPQTLQTIAAFDFGKQWLLLYFAGDQCNGAEPAGVTRTDDEIIIHINHLSFMPKCHDAALLVSPWLLIAFDAKKDMKVIIDNQVKIVECD